MSICDNCGQPTENTNHDIKPLCEPCMKLSERTPPIQMSPIKPEDLELVLAWRSNPKIYHHFRRQDTPLEWESHLLWYESRSDTRHDFIIHYEGRRVGVVSITECEKVSIYLGDFAARGQGVATGALRWLRERFKNRSPLIAEIHEENVSSKRLFKRCGFQPHGRDGEWVVYSYES